MIICFVCIPSSSHLFCNGRMSTFLIHHPETLIQQDPVISILWHCCILTITLKICITLREMGCPIRLLTTDFKDFQNPVSAFDSILLADFQKSSRIFKVPLADFQNPSRGFSNSLSRFFKILLAEFRQQAYQRSLTVQYLNVYQ